MQPSPYLFRISDSKAARMLEPVIHRLPEMEGGRLAIDLRPELSAWRGKLLSRDARGKAIHGASDIRKRRIILDSQLLSERRELQRIFVHEVYHFAWVRIGNQARWYFEKLLQQQFAASGELGWSAEMAKLALQPADRRQRTRRWRDYVCESFCDTAAFYYSSGSRHPEWTLARRHREERRRWFQEYIEGRPLFL